jgi:MoxR-like ATPase
MDSISKYVLGEFEGLSLNSVQARNKKKELKLLKNRYGVAFEKLGIPYEVPLFLRYVPSELEHGVHRRASDVFEPFYLTVGTTRKLCSVQSFELHYPAEEKNHFVLEFEKIREDSGIELFSIRTVPSFGDESQFISLDPDGQLTVTNDYSLRSFFSTERNSAFVHQFLLVLEQENLSKILSIDCSNNLVLKDRGNFIDQWCCYLSNKLIQHDDEDSLRIAQLEWHNDLTEFFFDPSNLIMKPSSLEYYDRLWNICKFQTRELFVKGIKEVGFEKVMDQLKVPVGHTPLFRRLIEKVNPRGSPNTEHSSCLPEDVRGFLPQPERVQQCLTTMIKLLNHQICGRDQVIRCMMLALLSGNHMLLLGPPGTGKSALASDLLNLIDQAKLSPSLFQNDYELDSAEKLFTLKPSFFKVLMTKMTSVDELFGPISLSELEKDNYIRLVQGYLPSTSIAFLDEIFKSNSAILNALLMILNERMFNNGQQLIKIPLLFLVGASNELPSNESLNALYDRFLFRSWIHPIQDEAEFVLMLKTSMRRHIVQIDDASLRNDSWKSQILNIHEIRAVQSYSSPDYSLHPNHFRLLSRIQHQLRNNEEIDYLISDRRFAQMVRVLQISAYCHGRVVVDWVDFLFVPHVIWNTAESEKSVAIVKSCWEDELKQSLHGKEESNQLKQRIQGYLFETEAAKKTWLELIPELHKPRILNICPSLGQGTSLRPAFSLSLFELNPDLFEWEDKFDVSLDENFDVVNYDIILLDGNFSLYYSPTHRHSERTTFDAINRLIVRYHFIFFSFTPPYPVF